MFFLSTFKKRTIKGEQTHSNDEETHSTTIQGWRNEYKESVIAGQG